jgi:signal transduction histidine kinase/HPt (histidine-containing phosphotransfer) domain-containing protein/ActR/RegA family two-component response regulator
MPFTVNALAEQLGQMDIFQSIPAPVLLHLAGKIRLEQFDTGALVFLKEQPGRALYLILDGAARVHDGDYTLTHMHTGHCFGEMALLDEGPRSMSVSATAPSTLARIDRDVFFDVLGDYPDIMQRIVSLLTRRLRFQTDKTLEELRRREEKLSQLVEERTAELMRQMAEAEHLREKAELEKQEAERQRRRAEQSERAEQQFLANMSHEIRTPMNAVMGMTNLLLQKKPREDQLLYLHSIRQSSEALLVILNDILDISKIQAGKLELENTGLEVAAILEQVRTTLQFRAEEKGLTLTVECDTAIPPLLTGDPVRLQQVLLNLAGNAVKFTDKGVVMLIARQTGLTRTHSRLHFEVRDTGIGMTPEQLAVVFESFRQASSETTRKYGGTGLGLSISKQLVELLGGSLAAKSSPGKGSAFWFDFDLEIRTENPLKKETPLQDAAAVLRNKRILVVEDNPFNRIVAVETLELQLPGVTIQTAEHGLEALRLVQESRFDVILMDISMPVMDGLEATQAIRALPPPYNAIPIVAFTASVTKKEVRRCLGHGMNACIPKPFKDAELLRTLLAVIEPNDTLQLPEEPPPGPEPPAAEPENPIQPLVFLEQLTGGNILRIRKYLGLYLQSTTAALPRIEAALETNDPEELRRAVHTLKPQFRFLGLETMAELAQEIETQLLEKATPATLSTPVRQLIGAIRRSVASYENYLQA